MQQQGRLAYICNTALCIMTPGARCARARILLFARSCVCLGQVKMQKLNHAQA